MAWIPLEIQDSWILWISFHGHPEGELPALELLPWEQNEPGEEKRRINLSGVGLDQHSWEMFSSLLQKKCYSHRSSFLESQVILISRKILTLPLRAENVLS